MKKIKKILKYSILLLSLGFTHLVLAQPIIVEGVVPDDASKLAILNKIRVVYGNDQIVDKIQVRSVTAPTGWSDSVTKVITPDLKKVSQGKLSITGTQIDLIGKLSNQSEVQPTTVAFQSLVAAPFRLHTQLSANQAEQKMIDDALKNRIIEFESGSAILTSVGTQILDEMAIALLKVQGKNVKIIGHTDSQGNATKNVMLSQKRAEAVKEYLVGKDIPVARLSTEGLGSQKPVADNATAEGRKKNRRIEFEVL